MRTLADRIKSLRLPGETQAQFAERLHTTQASISRYLNGRQPDRETLIKIARQTHVSLDWLLTGHGPGPGELMPGVVGDEAALKTIGDRIDDLDVLAEKDKIMLQNLIKTLVKDKAARPGLLTKLEELTK